MAEVPISKRMAVCMHTLSTGVCVYRWQGQMHEGREVLIPVKTVFWRYAELETAIRRLHPYDVAEIVAFPITRGMATYLKWIVDETA